MIDDEFKGRSLDEHRTLRYVEDERSFLRDVHRGVVVYVEGEADHDWLSRLLDPSVVVIPRTGRAAVEEQLREARQKDPFVIGIVDADFDRLGDEDLDGHSDASGLFYCDGHDAEMMFARAGTMLHVVSGFCQTKRWAAFHESHGCPLLHSLHQAVRMGRMMYAAKVHPQCSTSFQDLAYEKFICSKSLILNVDALANVVFGRSGWPSPEVVGEIKLAASASASACEEPVHLWELARGHDLTSILAIGLSNALGNWTGPKRNKKVRKGYFRRTTSEGTLEQSIRLAFGPEFFAKTELCRRLVLWAKSQGLTLVGRESLLLMAESGVGKEPN